MSDTENTQKPESEEKQRLRFDDASLLAYAQLYDNAKSHEPVVWLGRYCRDKCNGSLKLLATKAQKLGHDYSYTTLHKILTGKAFTARGVKQNGSVENMIAMVDALKMRDSADSKAGKIGFIETPTYFVIKNYFDKIRMPERVCKFGILFGHTGTQKTASFKHLCAINNNATSKQERFNKVNSTAPQICTHMDAPFRPSLSLFVEKLAECYGVTGASSTKDAMKQIRRQVNRFSTIIIENCQRLYKPQKYSEEDSLSQGVFNLVQELQEDTDCAIMLSFTADFFGTITAKMDAGYFEQFEGRAGGRSEFLILDEYPTKEDVIAIANGFNFLHADKHSDYLEKIVRRPGRIRVLITALQDARQAANEDNTELTFDFFRQNISPALRDAIEAKPKDTKEGK